METKSEKERVFISCSTSTSRKIESNLDYVAYHDCFLWQSPSQIRKVPSVKLVDKTAEPPGTSEIQRYRLDPKEPPWCSCLQESQSSAPGEVLDQSFCVIIAKSHKTKRWKDKYDNESNNTNSRTHQNSLPDILLTKMPGAVPHCFLSVATGILLQDGKFRWAFWKSSDAEDRVFLHQAALFWNLRNNSWNSKLSKNCKEICI